MTFEKGPESWAVNKPIPLAELNRVELFQQNGAVDKTEKFAVQDDFQIALMADKVKTQQLPDGGARTQYLMDGRLIYSDTQKQDGTRIQCNYNFAGGLDGKRIDYPNGSHVSNFGDTQVLSDRNGTHVMKRNLDGGWDEVKDQEERQEALAREKELFTPPHRLPSA